MSAFASCRFQNVNIFINYIDSSKEGSDCDYAAVSGQENRQQISLQSNRHFCLT